MTEPVDFLAVPLADGGVRVRLDRLTDGRIMCQLCFGFFHRAELNPVDGGVEDVCRPCAIEDAELTRRKRAGDSRPDPSSPEEAQNGPSDARTAPGGPVPASSLGAPATATSQRIDPTHPKETRNA